MIELLTGPRPLVPLESEIFGFYSRSTHLANALLPFVAANPYIHAGLYPYMDRARPTTVTTDERGTKSAGNTLYIAPSLRRVYERFTVPQLIGELNGAYNVASILSRQIHPRSIADLIREDFSSLSGTMLTALLDRELRESQPVPLSRVLNGMSEPVQGLTNWFEQFVTSGTYRFGTESESDAVPMLAAKVFPLSNEALASTDVRPGPWDWTLDEMLQIPSVMASLLSGAGVKWTEPSLEPGEKPAGPSGELENTAWMVSALEFLLALRQPDALKSALDSMAATTPTDHMNGLVPEATLAVLKRTVGGAKILMYYLLAPYIAQLQEVLRLYDLPLFPQGFNDMLVNVADQEELQAIRKRILAIKVPELLARTHGQGYDVTMRLRDMSSSGTSVASCFAPIIGPGVTKFTDTLSSPAFIKSLFTLNRALINGVLSWEELESAGNSLGMTPITDLAPIILRPEATADLLITDGLRSSSSVSTLVDWTRRHKITVETANTVQPTIAAVVYQPTDKDAAKQIYQVTSRVDVFDLAGDDAIKSVNKRGLLSTSVPCFLMPKAVIDSRDTVAIADANAALYVPAHRAPASSVSVGLQTASSLRELLDKMGYVGVPTRRATTLRFVGRFLGSESTSKDGKTFMISADRENVRYVNSNLLVPADVFHHWRFITITKRFTDRSDLDATPSYLFVSLPTFETVLSLLDKGFVLDLGQKMATDMKIEQLPFNPDRVNAD